MSFAVCVFCVPFNFISVLLFHSFKLEPIFLETVLIQGNVLGTTDTMVNRRDRSSGYQGTYIPLGKKIIRNINMEYYVM